MCFISASGENDFSPASGLFGAPREQPAKTRKTTNTHACNKQRLTCRGDLIRASRSFSSTRGATVMNRAGPNEPPRSKPGILLRLVQSLQFPARGGRIRTPHGTRLQTGADGARQVVRHAEIGRAHA